MNKDIELLEKTNHELLNCYTSLDSMGMVQKPKLSMLKSAR